MPRTAKTQCAACRTFRGDQPATYFEIAYLTAEASGQSMKFRCPFRAYGPIVVVTALFHRSNDVATHSGWASLSMKF